MDQRVMDIQEALAGQGLYDGKIDGITGEKTSAGIKAFQRKYGLEDDGIVGKLTYARLFPSPIPDKDRLTYDWPKQGEASMNAFFGDKGENQGRLSLPFPMYLAWDLETRITAITLNKKVIESARRVFDEISRVYTPGKRTELGINIFGGSLNVRRMVGGTNWSIHSWGCAIDFDPARNSLRQSHSTARLAREDAIPFWLAWEREGWASLGRSRDYDWMHVQAARL